MSRGRLSLEQSWDVPRQPRISPAVETPIAVNRCELRHAYVLNYFYAANVTVLSQDRGLPRAFAGRQDRRRLRLRPVQAHHQVDRPVRGGQPVGIIVLAQRANRPNSSSFAAASGY